jgi:hypothetical protein
MNAFIAAIANMFSEDKEVVAPAKVSWEARKKAANVAIDRALLKVHNASRAAHLAKLDIAAKLRLEVEACCAKGCAAAFASVERSIRCFDRAGC